MNYELAKELKDAGFPQRLDELSPMAITERGCTYYDEHTHALLSLVTGEISIPTLSELIEACGKDFHVLVHTTNGGMDSDKEFWGASTTKYARDFHNASTPEEAVARLWLVLNVKDIVDRTIDDTFLEDIRAFSGLDVQTFEDCYVIKPGRIIDIRKEGTRLRAIWQEDKKHLIVREFFNYGDT